MTMKFPIDDRAVLWSDLYTLTPKARSMSHIILCAVQWLNWPCEFRSVGWQSSIYTYLNSNDTFQILCCIYALICVANWGWVIARCHAKPNNGIWGDFVRYTIIAFARSKNSEARAVCVGMCFANNCSSIFNIHYCFAVFFFFLVWRT